MGIRKYKPTTPGRRGASVADFVEVTRDEPEKSLVRPLHGKGGRNAHGRITTRHKGGGHKRSYRVSFARYRELAPAHQPEVGLRATVEELKNGLERMGFADREFRSSPLVRLFLLQDLRERTSLALEVEL